MWLWLRNQITRNNRTNDPTRRAKDRKTAVVHKVKFLLDKLEERTVPTVTNEATHAVFTGPNGIQDAILDVGAGNGTTTAPIVLDVLVDFAGGFNGFVVPSDRSNLVIRTDPSTTSLSTPVISGPIDRNDPAFVNYHVGGGTGASTLLSNLDPASLGATIIVGDGLSATGGTGPLTNLTIGDPQTQTPYQAGVSGGFLINGPATGTSASTTAVLVRSNVYNFTLQNSAITGFNQLNQVGIDFENAPLFGTSTGGTAYRAVIQQNSISGNSIGIRFPGAEQNILVQNNFIGSSPVNATGNTFGVDFTSNYNTSTGPSGTTFGVRFRENSIVGNTNLALVNDSPNLVDVSDNWWGSIAGPSATGGANGLGGIGTGKWDASPFISGNQLSDGFDQQTGASAPGYQPNVGGTGGSKVLFPGAGAFLSSTTTGTAGILPSGTAGTLIQPMSLRVTDAFSLAASSSATATTRYIAQATTSSATGYIQEGVNDIGVGGTVRVLPSTFADSAYFESTNIGKSLTVVGGLGSGGVTGNETISPILNPASRSTETVIVPFTAFGATGLSATPATGSGFNVSTATGASITISGFTITGQDPFFNIGATGAVGSGRDMISGVTASVATGATGPSNLTVSNNIITHGTGGTSAGIIINQLGGGTATPMNVSITGNDIGDISTGVSLAGNVYGSVTFNRTGRLTVGGTAPAGTGPGILANGIIADQYGAIPTGTGANPSLDISFNGVSPATGGNVIEATNIGIQLSNVGTGASGGTFTVRNNAVNNSISTLNSSGTAFANGTGPVQTGSTGFFFNNLNFSATAAGSISGSTNTARNFETDFKVQDVAATVGGATFGTVGINLANSNATNTAFGPTTGILVTNSATAVAPAFITRALISGGTTVTGTTTGVKAQDLNTSAGATTSAGTSGQVLLTISGGIYTATNTGLDTSTTGGTSTRTDVQVQVANAIFTVAASGGIATGVNVQDAIVSLTGTSSQVTVSGGTTNIGVNVNQTAAATGGGGTAMVDLQNLTLTVSNGTGILVANGGRAAISGNGTSTTINVSGATAIGIDVTSATGGVGGAAQLDVSDGVTLNNFFTGGTASVGATGGGTPGTTAINLTGASVGMIGIRVNGANLSTVANIGGAATTGPSAAVTITATGASDSIGVRAIGATSAGTGPAVRLRATTIALSSATAGNTAIGIDAIDSAVTLWQGNVFNNGRTGLRVLKTLGSGGTAGPSTATLVLSTFASGTNTLQNNSSFVAQSGDFIELGAGVSSGTELTGTGLTFQIPGEASATVVTAPSTSQATASTNIARGYAVENKIIDAIDGGFGATGGTGRGHIRLASNSIFVTTSSFTSGTGSSGTAGVFGNGNMSFADPLPTFSPSIQRGLDVAAVFGATNNIFVQGGGTATPYVDPTGGLIVNTNTGAGSTNLFGTSPTGGTNFLSTAASRTNLANEAVITANSATGGGPAVTLLASNESIQGFRIVPATGTAAFNSTGSGAVGNGGVQSNVTISNNTIDDFGGTYVNLPQTIGATVSNNILANTVVANGGASTGISIGSFSSQVAITNNVISGHSGGATGSAGELSTAGVGLVLGGANPSHTITGNLFSNNRIGIFVGTTGADLGNGTIVRNNSFVPNGPGGRAINNRSTEVLDAPGNWWGSNGPSDVQATVGQSASPSQFFNVDISPYLNVGTNLSVTGQGFSGDFSTLDVVSPAISNARPGNPNPIEKALRLLPASGATTLNIMPTGTGARYSATSPGTDGVDTTPGAALSVGGTVSATGPMTWAIAQGIGGTGGQVTNSPTGTGATAPAPGLVQLTGPLTLTSNVTLQMNVDSNGTSDRYDVLGSANVDTVKLSGSIINNAPPPANGVPTGPATQPIFVVTATSATSSAGGAGSTLTGSPFNFLFRPTFGGTGTVGLAARVTASGTAIQLSSAPSNVFADASQGTAAFGTVVASGPDQNHIVGIDVFPNIETALAVLNGGGAANSVVNIVGGTYTPSVPLTLNLTGETIVVPTANNTAVTINSSAATAIIMTGASAQITGNNLLSIKNAATGGSGTTGILVTSGTASTATTAMINGVGVDGYNNATTGTGILVNNGASASILNDVLGAGAGQTGSNGVVGNLVDIAVDGSNSKALLQGNTLIDGPGANNGTPTNNGLRVSNGAQVDAGTSTSGTAGAVNIITGLGTSVGLNTFRGYTSAATGGSLAILQSNIGSQLPQAVAVPGAVVYARDDRFETTAGTSVPDYASIESRVFHFVDNNAFDYVDYSNAQAVANPAVVSSSLVFSGASSGSIVNTVPNQRSMVRGMTFTINAPVYALNSATIINLVRASAGTAYEATVYPNAQGTGSIGLGVGSVTAPNFGSVTVGTPNGTTGQTQVTVFFASSGSATTGSFTEFGSLVDGKYTLGLNATNINLLYAGSGLNAVSATPAYRDAASTTNPSFYRMFGDMNGGLADPSLGTGITTGQPFFGVSATDIAFRNDALNNAGSAYRNFLDFNGDGTPTNAELVGGTSPWGSRNNVDFNS